MATRIVIDQASIEEDEGHKPQEFIVAESFDEVLDRVMPISAPSSMLDIRVKRIYHDFGDGHRILIHENNIEWWEEVDPEDDEEP